MRFVYFALITLVASANDRFKNAAFKNAESRPDGGTG